MSIDIKILDSCSHWLKAQVNWPSRHHRLCVPLWFFAQRPSDSACGFTRTWMSLERELVISIGEDEDRTGWESTWITGKGLNSFLNHSTAIKLIADAGTNHSTRGRAPLKNPLVPSSLQIVCNASLQPLYLHQWLEIINKKLEPKGPVQHFYTVQSKP